jgi:hypothetical protein
MKKLILTVSVALLSGCSLLDAYLMKYDPIEYQQIADIRTSAFFAKSTCDNSEQSKLQADIVAKKTYAFKNYVEYTPHNLQVIASAGELDKMSQGLIAQYQKGPVSVAFCKIKFDNIEKSAETMQKTIGAKPR